MPVRRISIVGLAANAAALVLLGLTGAALAGPSLPADIAGFIGGSTPLVSFSHAFIDTLSPLFLSGVGSGSSSIIVSIGSSSIVAISGLLYAVYASVTTLISGSSILLLSDSGGILGSGAHLIGYVLGSDLSGLGPLSSVSSIADLPIYGGPYTTGYGLDSFFFVVTPGVRIPEPNAIAVVVTAVAAVAALLGRRRLRRDKG
jgi:hypothetical protein